ncbi:MAG: hypothetical protein IPK95_09935 [Cellvibrionales bacterium]|nr:hypothetical protein [Cellvibrionales bacterium]
MSPSGNKTFILKGMHNTRGEEMEVAPGSGHMVRIQADDGMTPDFGLLMKSI